MVGNKPVFFKEGFVEKERLMRCIIPLMVSLGQGWHVVQHKKFPQMLSRIQKMRMQRQRATDRRQLIDVLKLNMT